MSDNANLFDAGTVQGGGGGAAQEPGSPVERTGAPRVVTADRGQLAWRTCDLESLLPAEHRARLIWSAVEKLDLTKFYEPIAARENEPGRPAIDPKILVALWLYATSEGVGSAREVARLCGAHDAYRWICGGVSVNHHTLSDFRVGHAEALDDLMTQVLAVLMHGGLVTLERVAQDGMRVRASAGAASFRREPTLKACLDAARKQVEEGKRQADEPDTQRTARERAAAERAAREREERVTHALAELPKARAAKSGTKEKEQARVSTTDPEARVMKMGDGGYRPAYNAQFATDTASRVIVGAGVTNSGSDMGQTDPMRAEIERRTGGQPKELLIDGGFVKKESIEDASSAGTTVYAPVPKPRVDGIDPHQPKPGDSAAVAEWRQRMATPEAKDIYKQRAATAETVNADLRTWRGLDRFLVRGSGKVLNVILWSAITYNVMRWIGAGLSG
jgi:transposase